MGRYGLGERVARAAGVGGFRCVGNEGERNTQGVQVWRQPLQGLFTPDFARFTVRQESRACSVLCTFPLGGLGAPWL